jgi:hypothetical protein
VLASRLSGIARVDWYCQSLDLRRSRGWWWWPVVVWWCRADNFGGELNCVVLRYWRRWALWSFSDKEGAQCK